MVPSTGDNQLHIAKENLSDDIRTIFSGKYFIIFVVSTVLLFKLYDKACSRSHKLTKKTLEYFKELPSYPLVGVIPYVYLHKNGIIKYLANIKDLFKLAIDFGSRYGPCFHTRVLGMDIFGIHDPNLLKPLLLSNEVGHLEKFDLMYGNQLVGAVKNGLLSLPAKDWFPHRKILSPLYTHTGIKNYIQIFKRHAELLVADLINDISSSNNPPYKRFVHLRTLDIITEILVGVPFESVLGTKESLKFYHNLETKFRIAADKTHFKHWKLIPFLWYFDPQKKELDKCVKELEAAVLKVREAHVIQDESNFALDIMVKAKFSDKEILAELITLIIGGHDTISTSFVLHLWLLALEQKHQIACQREVDKLFDRLEQSGEELTLNSLSELKYLERCVKESLRLFPSTGSGTIREIKSPLKLNDDVTLVPGNIAFFLHYVLHRNPEVFPDPEKFDPDRFLPENVISRHPYAYLPFSAGPRNCLGWKAAMPELIVLSAYVLRHFHMTTTDKREDIKFTPLLTLQTSKDPNVKFFRRR